MRERERDRERDRERQTDGGEREDIRPKGFPFYNMKIKTNFK